MTMGNFSMKWSETLTSEQECLENYFYLLQDADLLLQKSSLSKKDVDAIYNGKRILRRVAMQKMSEIKEMTEWLEKILEVNSIE